MSELEICKDHCNGGVYFEDADCYVCNMQSEIAALTKERDIAVEKIHYTPWGDAMSYEELADEINTLVNLRNIKDREIAALRKQVERMPVCAGYVDESALYHITHINQAALIRVLPPQDLDRRNYFPIYIDPPEEIGNG